MVTEWSHSKIGGIEMLAFFDESGHPHPNDAATRPICVATCIAARDCRLISGRLHALKRDILGKEDMEIKAKNLLNRNTFRRAPDKKEFVEEFYNLLRILQITIFAIIMERPQTVPPNELNYLPNQFRYLLQRCDLLAQTEDRMLTCLFDGQGYQCGGLVLKFNSFLYRSNEGRAMTTITDAPFFVDSRITAGIQIADMAAGCIRIYEANNLFRGVPRGDSFLSAIRRYYHILENKTIDQQDIGGFLRNGFYRMPERDHYLVNEASVMHFGNTEEETQE